MKRVTVYSTIGAILTICFFIVIAAGEDCDGCFSPPVMALKFLACGFVVIVVTLLFRRDFKKHEGIAFEIEGQPLLETDEATDGVPFAGQGMIDAEDGKALVSPFTGTKCVYYHSILEKYVKRGKRSAWEIQQNAVNYVPFHFKDGRGTINVLLSNMDEDFSGFDIHLGPGGFHDPQHSEIDCLAVLKKSEYAENSKTNFLGIPFSSTRYRRSEYVLVPGTKVFIYGTIVKLDGGKLAIRENEQCPLIISMKDRDRYVEDFYKGSGLLYFSYVLIALGYTVILNAANYFFRFEGLFLSLLLIIGNTAILSGIIFSLYNRLITLKHRALNAQSNIEVELKRRADLIPNLAEAVKGYSKHENDIQRFVAEARAEMVFAKTENAKTSPVVPSLLAIVEKYPDLKASGNFQALMKTLADTEQRIAYSREFYNRTTRKYNTLITQFPFMLISLSFGMKEMEYIAISRGERAVPQVSIQEEKQAAA